MSLFLISFAALFSVVNPLGTVPIFIGLTKEKSRKEITSIAIWASFNTFIILVVSFFSGSYILDFFWNKSRIITNIWGYYNCNVWLCFINRKFF